MAATVWAIPRPARREIALIQISRPPDELKKRDNTSWNIAQLVFLANLRVLKMADLGELLTVTDAKSQKDLYNMLQAQNMLMSNMGMYVMNKEDEMQTFQYSFSGLNDIYESFMLDISGACEIPITKLFGRAPGGLSAGDQDLQNYYDTIQQKQTSHLKPVLDKLIPIMLISEFGSIPDDFDYGFNPIQNPTDKDKAELAEKLSNAVVNAFTQGIISQKIAMKELKQQSDLTGLFSNISDEDIEQADDYIPTTLGGDVDEYGAMETEAQNRSNVPTFTKSNDEKPRKAVNWFRKS